MDIRPGTPEFQSAIDAASTIEDIDRLRERLDYSAAEFCRHANVNESAYSRARREGRTPRHRTIRNLKDTLRRLEAARQEPRVVPLRRVE